MGVDSFGEWVRRQRAGLLLTQRDLAERTFCSVNSIKKIEQDQRRPSRELAIKLATVLGVPTALHELVADCARGVRPLATLLSAQAGGGTQSVLSRLLPPLIGRDDELRQLLRLLEAARLVTIVGQGGSGKTRLAQALIAHFHDRRHPAVFVALVGLTAAENLAAAIAHALGLELSARYDPATQLLDALRTRSHLLVLDNFEHLLAGAALVQRILHTAPGITLVVTSRERLQLPEEQLLPLAGLPYPDSAHDPALADAPAARLFLQAARRLLPGYSVDAATLWQLCDLTAGLPLALELAANWVDVLPSAELVAELAHNLDLLARADGGGPARHRSMRAVFDMTWQRLNAAEQDSLARLVVFQGGFTRAGATAVAGATLATLAALRQHSLIALDAAGGRYQMHALLRQYALAQLERRHARPAAELAHATYFLTLARAFERALHTPAQRDWLNQLEQEDDNLRAALRWLLHSDPPAAAALALALAWYWRLSSRIVEGHGWLTQALAANQGSTDSAMLAGLHFSIGHKLWMQGEFAAARQQQAQSVTLWRALGADGTRGLALALHSLGMIADQTGDYHTACAHLRQSMALFEQAGDAWGVAFAQQWLGASSLKLGDLVTSRANLEASIATQRRLGDQWALGLDLVWLAQLALAEGEAVRAADLAREAGMLLLAFGHRHGYGAALEVLASAALQQGDRRQAQHHLAAAAELYHEIGNEHLAQSVRQMLAA